MKRSMRPIKGMKRFKSIIAIHKKRFIKPYRNNICCDLLFITAFYVKMDSDIRESLYIRESLDICGVRYMGAFGHTRGFG